MRGWRRWQREFRFLQLAITLALAMMGPLTLGLYGQEFDKTGDLFFTKPYGGADPLPQILTVTGANSPIEFSASARTSSGGDWLSVSPTEDCCITPAPVTVMVKPSSTLAVGNYSGQIVLTGKGSSSFVEVHLVVTPADATTFDKTPPQLSFSMMPGGRVSSQFMQISTVGEETLQWRLIAATFNGADFLSVSAQTGIGRTRITVGVLPEKLPNAGATAGVYTGQLLFLSAGSTVTIPVSVRVGDTESGLVKSLTAKKPAGTPLAMSPTSGPNPNLWPANTANCFCGGFGDQDTGYGGNTAAPDGTNSAKLVIEANPGNGAVPHYEYLYPDLYTGPGAQQLTLSFHLKAALDSWAYITSRVDGTVRRAFFNLANGVAGSNDFPASSTQITPLANGWYRCVVTFTASSSAVYNGFGLATGDQQSAYIATAGNGVYEWGQQAEQGTLSPYQEKDTPCFSPGVQRDAGVVLPGSSIGFTVSVFNQATPALATTLSEPLPAGPGVNWSIGPASYAGPGTCSITGAVGSQALSCDFLTLAAGAGAALHVTSGTTSSSCGVYATTATVTAGGVTFPATDSMTVQCLSPTLSVSKTHTGSFFQGQNGATYTVVVSNVGSAATSGTVTVTETVPSGLTLVSMAGTGWTCPGTASNNCTRSSVLNPGNSYPAITVTVNVSVSATSPQVNQVNVSFGGSTVANTTDSTTILANVAGINPLQFVSVAPCRVMDTRNSNGPLGGPFIAGGTTRSIPISSACGLPSNAVAYSLNMTVVPRNGTLSYLSVWPTGQSQPLVSTLNSFDGSTLANAAIVPAGTSGSINAYATEDTELVVDINGYFVPPATGTLQFYPLTPCRILDTRNANGTFGGPALLGGTSRSFPVPSSACGVPAAAAYSLNVTVVPHGVLGYLTTWPTGQSQPFVSTLNSHDGTVLANAAIVPAGTNGAVSFFASNTTDVVVDINGYFAPPATGGLNFYTVTPCRIVDTRNANGTFGGPILNTGTTRAFPLSQASCGLPANTAAYSLNMTVVPSGVLGYLTTWATGGVQPLVSTLNAFKGQVVANAALVPGGTSASINVYVPNTTHVIIDTNGYFGQ